MTSFIKTVYRSGIIGDFFKRTLTSKPDNTVERIVCIRRYDNGRCVKYEQPLWVNEVVINKDCNENNYLVFSNPFSAFFSSANAKAQPTTVSTTTSLAAAVPNATSYFETNYEQMIKGLLGNAESGTVYITYWYNSLRHVVYYDIPEHTVKFPLYAPEMPIVTETTTEEAQQMTFTDDDQFVAFVQLVFRKKKTIVAAVPKKASVAVTADDEQEEEEEETLDVTDVVKPFLGPKNDFHGMALNRLGSSAAASLAQRDSARKKQPFDFMKVVDYAMFVDKQPMAASSVHRLHYVPFMRITYGDMNVAEYFI